MHFCSFTFFPSLASTKATSPYKIYQENFGRKAIKWLKIANKKSSLILTMEVRVLLFSFQLNSKDAALGQEGGKKSQLHQNRWWEKRERKKKGFCRNFSKKKVGRPVVLELDFLF